MPLLKVFRYFRYGLWFVILGYVALGIFFGVGVVGGLSRQVIKIVDLGG